jgi:predicted RNase H-like nuclease (RuvC/YqgF family)
MSQEEKAKIIAGEIAQVEAQLNEMKKQKQQLQQIISTFEVIRETYQAFLDSTNAEQLPEQLELDLYPEAEQEKIAELFPNMAEAAK